MVIFGYTSSPQVKISQKVLGGSYFFLTHTACVSFFKYTVQCFDIDMSVCTDFIFFTLFMF